MPFDYYHKLSRPQQAIYRQSDEISSIAVPQVDPLQALAKDIAPALEGEDRPEVNRLCQELSDELLDQLGVPSVLVRVLNARPSRNWGELHGLYEPPEDGAIARITVWMRTAQQKRPVAFRTFLRTVLHELGHHLDYELLELADSYHTEGFFKRESSLFKVLVP